MRSLKSGDKVRCKVDLLDGIQKGDIRIVESVYNGSVFSFIKLKDNMFIYCEENFELVEEVKDNEQLQDEIDDLCTQIEMKDEELNNLIKRIRDLCDIISEYDEEIITYGLLDEIKEKEMDELEEELQISHDEYSQLYTKFQTLKNMCTQLGILVYV